MMYNTDRISEAAISRNIYKQDSEVKGAKIDKIYLLIHQ